MKLPLSWLNDYVDTSGIKPLKLADKLVNIGFEVEEVIYTGEGISKVYTGKITDIVAHPDAIKLVICALDCGKIGHFTIVTGAKNVSVGDIVPVATNGATLPGDKKIVTSALRGVTSEGMLCSGGELGVDDYVVDGASVDGILILPQSTELGQDIKDTLGLDDYIFDVSITANRPDLQSIYGLAREIATLIKRDIKPLELSYETIDADVTPIDIKIDDLSVCTRYTGRVITDFKIEPSPKWMQRRLRLMGLKPINNAVDVTNYVLMEVGQPLHAFDINHIDEYIWVRNAGKGEKVKLLDGVVHELKENMLVIADKSKAHSVAGVMGGEFSGISDETTTVFLESARFTRGSIRATSRALGLRSDSSSRYEKGVDYISIDTGRERALSLYHHLNAGKVCSYKTQNEIDRPQEKMIITSSKQISDLLGIKVSSKMICRILSDLGIKSTLSGKNIECNIPLFREDIDNFTDLAEEVIRYYGYDKIKSGGFASGATTVGGYSELDNKINSVKSSMIALGGHEVISYSFTNLKQYDKINIDKNDKLREVITILNPLNEDYSIMRTQTISSMLDIIHTNTSRKNNNFRLFEVAKVYIPKQLPLTELPNENDVLSIGFCGENEDFYSLKNAVNVIMEKFNMPYDIKYSTKSFLHPGISAEIYNGETYLGCFGKVHPSVGKNYDLPDSVYVAQIELEPLFAVEMGNVIFENLPKYPSVDRDLAVIVKDEFMVGELDKCIKETSGELCESVNLFDIYKGEQIEEGNKSIAFSIKLRAKDRTLKEAEIQEVMQNIMDALKTKFGAYLR